MRASRSGSRTQRLLIIATAALSAVAVSCAAPDDGAPPDTPTTTVGRHLVETNLAPRIDAFFTTSYVDGFRNVRAVLVLVDGQPAFENYNNSTPAATANTSDVTKSVMSMLIGVALDERRIPSVDATVLELLPSDAARMAPEVKGITLRQLLTMTAGQKIDVGIPDFEQSADWVGTILATPPTHPPGGGSHYSSAASHLLSAILVQATGRSVLDYAREKLFIPLGIDTDPAAEPVVRAENVAAYDSAGFAWPVDPQGIHVGHSLLKITAPDMAKLGQLYLHKGQWNGRQLVSAGWVEESTRAHAAVFGQVAFTAQYGFHWWVTSADGHPAFAAMGDEGQLIEVVPELDLVVVVSSNDGPNNATADVYAEMVNLAVAPAIHPIN